jgi:serine O-acetyltransferase
MPPERIWAWSRRAYQRGWRRTAQALKAVNFLVYRCVLPPETEVTGSLTLLHHGLGVVVHPQVRIEDGVTISHGVTLGAAGPDGQSGSRVVLKRDCFIGAGAIVLARSGRTVVVGERAAVGAGAVVVDDVASRTRVASPKAVVVRTST